MLGNYREMLTARKDGHLGLLLESREGYPLLVPGSIPGGPQNQNQQTMDAYKNKRGEQLKPLNVGPQTWLLVSPDKATKERAEKFKRDCERSQRMAKNIR